jgi:hypothetical protein
VPEHVRMSVAGHIKSSRQILVPGLPFTRSRPILARIHMFNEWSGFAIFTALRREPFRGLKRLACLKSELVRGCRDPARAVPSY